MRAPRQGDVVRASRLLGTIGERVPSPARQIAELLGTLGRIVPAELITLSVCDLEAGRRLVSAHPAARLAASDLATFDRLMHAHPLVRYHQRHPRARVRRLSDCIADPALRQTPLWADYYAPLGLGRAALIPIEWEPDRLVGIVLNRGEPDFGDGEASLLETLRPTVAALYRQARAAACLACASGMLHRAAADGRTAAVTLDPGLGVVGMSGKAMAWLAEIARQLPPEPGAMLPTPIRTWLRAQVSESAAMQCSPQSSTCIEAGAGVRLSLQCLPAEGHSNCTLLIELDDDRGDRLPRERFTQSLTARQLEILGWIAAGKTDDCIAQLLGVSRRTVGKHLQNMYRRLGVANRTGAVMRVLGR